MPSILCDTTISLVPSADLWAMLLDYDASICAGVQYPFQTDIPLAITELADRYGVNLDD